MIQALFVASLRRKISWVLFALLLFQTVYPAAALALTSGPVQPEAQGFEPVGTTDMVDLFTGDFVYNIPLLDVEGYPINISYHGGVGMEQEASWVGLGWNINPGAVNRAVRGLPDEFAGDIVEKHYFVKPDKTTKIGLSAGVEAFGVGDPNINISADLGGYLTISNYRGVSVDLTTNVGVNTRIAMLNGGLNLGTSVGSQTGATINYGAQIGIGLNFNATSDISAGASFNLNTGGNYNPRSGTHNYRSMDVKVSMSERTTGAGSSFSTGTYVPIGLQNHTAVITNPSYSNSYSGQLKLGGEMFGFYGHGKIFGSFMETGFQPDGSRKSYGYLNLERADPGGHDLLDFSREKDGMYNSTMDLLPQSHLTYDVYSVAGQGTGGSFRPHRNDIGSVYDPVTEGGGHAYDINLEGALGELFEVGGEYKTSTTEIKSGPWDEYSRPFKSPESSGYYENVYFKEAGELTENNQSYLNGIGGQQIIKPEAMNGIGIMKPGGASRVTRANHIYPVYAALKDTALLLDTKDIISYESAGFKNYPNIPKTQIARAGTGDALQRKPSQITEIVQVQKDGRRYIYGLPVINNVQRETIYAIGSTQKNQGTYLVNYQPDQDDKPGNGNGIDNFYSSTVTPSYVSAHLLTGVLSSDYIDVTGDGITDDDLGTYTKFNYTRKSKDYRWRAPIDSDKSQYIPGYISDTHDDKATYLIGSRENWMLHSVETKNYLAEFYVSPRSDAKGVNNKILSNSALVYNNAQYLAKALDSDQRSYKLDSIVLYNKHDRFEHGNNAQAIKTVLFSYDYTLCPGVPNAPANTGKLTLRKIQMRYGHSNINMSAGYTFGYSDKNYAYSSASKDRWGSYKPNDTQFNNYQFPFTVQSPATNDYAQAWSLTNIGLPSGGGIKVDYESDDYAYVQDKEAMEMFKLVGLGHASNYDDGTELYHSSSQPNLYLYFNRRINAENPNLSFRDNYLKGAGLLYYNVPVELRNGKYEPIKGYAQVDSIGICPNDNLRGYIKLKAQPLQGSGNPASPITYTALNIGRYNLPHIMFPGSDPENSDIVNVVTGLYNSFGELFHSAENPLEFYMDKSLGKEADLAKAFVRLTSPGLRKMGGGQRVKKISFFDNWVKMGGGLQASYGKEYNYTIEREDKKGFISSGVASWEPVTGGDELPQREPKPFHAQLGSVFPPNDPVDLYQELPIGESFYPAPIVGYRKVTARSIHQTEGRSSQFEDVNYFYTAKEYPVSAQYSSINKGDNNAFKLQNTKIDEWATQGFVITLNDMHGKPLNTEHWVLKPDTSANSRELITYQHNEYQGVPGQLNNDVPVFSYSPMQGKLNISSKKLGLETDITVDTRKKYERTETDDYSVNVNGFVVGVVPIVIPLPYPWGFENSVTFKSATVTKIVQQYGILNKVTSYNQGAITELRNEVFDAQTGNALVTSLNNEFKDKQYSVSYPAHWAYKEMGPSYENQNLQGVFSSVKVDTFGDYVKRFANYNGAYSYSYPLPSNMPVGLAPVDNDLPMYKPGDQVMLQLGNPGALRSWVMGYTSDSSHCYVVLATREPYEATGDWSIGHTIANVGYRVVQSGNRNRLGESIEHYTTTNAGNIFPSLKDNLPDLLSLSASRYNHNLSQVYAANLTSDSLNPFVTGKVGIYRPQMEVLNLTNRNYNTGASRTAGLFKSASYWKTELDTLAYCQYAADTDSVFTGCALDTFKVLPAPATSTNMYSDTIRFYFVPKLTRGCDSQRISIERWDTPSHTFYHYVFSPTTGPIYLPHIPSFLNGDKAIMGIHYDNGCCSISFYIDYNGTVTPIAVGQLTGSASVTWPGTWYNSTPGPYTGNIGSITALPRRVTKKILLGKVGRYAGSDNENWVKTNEVTKYNWYGAELENKEEGIGYNSAVYGYNQQLPACVAKNARAGEVLFDGFEDYALLQAKPSMRKQYMQLLYSPFAAYLGNMTGLGSLYQISTLAGTNSMPYSISTAETHSGTYSLKTDNTVIIPLSGYAANAKGYSFGLDTGQSYVASIWMRPQSIGTGALTQGYGAHISVIMDTVISSTPSAAKLTNLFVSKSNIIDGWQQYELNFRVPAGYKSFKLSLDGSNYYDDLRIYPAQSNSKAFVYHPVTRKLMATLDENNYATFYEYDAEGNLIRTKKETEQGIMTLSESRGTHYKMP